MNWDQVEGKWVQMRGSLKEKFGKLTDDDLKIISGNRDKFLGKLQERYGVQKEEAQRLADEWLRSADASSTPKTHTGRP
ncbi:MAG TPA: CsbD family protein [Candidatus Acidoferrales bacterium]|nr:CsbD family protein [Candidatus Acidoferrales bacterium]